MKNKALWLLLMIFVLAGCNHYSPEKITDIGSEIRIVNKGKEVVLKRGPEINAVYRIFGKIKKKDLGEIHDFSEGMIAGAPLEEIPQDRSFTREDIDKALWIILFSRDPEIREKCYLVLEDKQWDWAKVRISGNQLILEKFRYNGETVQIPPSARYLEVTNIEPDTSFNTTAQETIAAFTPPATPIADDFHFGQATYREPFTGIEFVFVRGGTYQMGETLTREGERNEEECVEEKEVTVEDFYLSKYEISQAQWEKVMGGNPSFHKGDNFPVERIMWNQMTEFLSRLSRVSNKRIRLPFEAEWEYAARSRGKKETWAGTSDKYQLPDYAWLDVNSGFVTHPIGTKKPNGLGLYDMTGNVSEWCQDISGYYSYPPYDDGKEKRPNFIFRGGCYLSSYIGCQTGIKHYSWYANSGGEHTGFRPAFGRE